MFADRQRAGVTPEPGHAQPRATAALVRRARSGDSADCADCAGPAAVARDDPLEAEADRLAERALRAAPSVAVRAPHVPATSSAPTNVQPPAVRAPLTPVTRAGPAEDPVCATTEASNEAHAALASPGTALAPALRADMERRLGFDFAAVRVYSGSSAARSARALHADAYTLGHHVVFGAGQFAPETRQGRQLLAHELVHIQQQRGAAPRVQRKPTDPDELAAISKEDAAVTDLAKRALASGKPETAIGEVLRRLIRSRGLDMHSELSPGSRYEKARKGVAIEHQGKGPATTGFLVAGDDALRRVANGQVAQVAKELEAQLAGVDAARGTIDYVFIMGTDPPVKKGKKANPYYAEAKAYFTAQYPNATMIEDVRDLEGINTRINAGGKPVHDLIIVSHAHADGTVAFSLNPSDKTPHQLQYAELKEANNKGTLVKPDPGLVGSWTNVLIRGCNLGRSEAMLGEVQTAFGGKARVIAPTHSQLYSGGTTEAMAGPYYEEPGKSKLTDEQAFARIKAKPEYSFVTDWKAMRGTLKRTDDSITPPEIVYEGPFPARGGEMAFLAATSPKSPVKEYKFSGSRIEGVQTVFEFTAIHPFKFGPVTIRQETPPDDAAAITIAKQRVARPDAYAYKVRRPRRGAHLTVVVDVVRTEWNLYHSVLHKAGKPLSPSPGVKPWFGDTGH